jgi:hypothetical protein
MKVTREPDRTQDRPDCTQHPWRNVVVLRGCFDVTGAASNAEAKKVVC